MKKTFGDRCGALCIRGIGREQHCQVLGNFHHRARSFVRSVCWSCEEGKEGAVLPGPYKYGEWKTNFKLYSKSASVPTRM